MKIGDKIYDTFLGRYGVLRSNAYYRRDPERSTDSNSIFVLYYSVEYDDDYTPLATKAEEIVLADIPNICAFMKVDISMHADKYYGMKGIVVEPPDWSSALVKIYGYQNPVRFKLSDLEPWIQGSDLECWLDTL